MKQLAMRILALIVVLLTLPAPAQQPVPDAPQPQKKQTAKPPDPVPPPTKDDNAFPEDVSRQAAEEQTKPPKTDTANPFPEEQSKAAAKAAGDDVKGTAPVHESVHDPVRSRKDDEVGGFYLKKGDYQGALSRYQDATAADPTNVSAIFGLAEAQRMLKKNADATHNYELYLDIVPDGPKAKQALKALKGIQAGK